MKKPDIKKLQEQCDNFNGICKVGERIMFKKDGVDEPFEARTRSEAYVLSGHSAVVLVEGISGCYQLSHCEPITEKMKPEAAAVVIKVRLGSYLGRREISQ